MSRNQATVVATGTTSRRQSNATKQRNILSETGGGTEREREREEEGSCRNISVIFPEICLETIDRFVERRWTALETSDLSRRDKRAGRSFSSFCSRRFWISNFPRRDRDSTSSSFPSSARNRVLPASVFANEAFAIPRQPLWRRGLVLCAPILPLRHPLRLSFCLSLSLRDSPRVPISLCIRGSVGFRPKTRAETPGTSKTDFNPVDRGCAFEIISWSRGDTPRIPRNDLERGRFRTRVSFVDRCVTIRCGGFSWNRDAIPFCRSITEIGISYDIQIPSSRISTNFNDRFLDSR